MNGAPLPVGVVGVGSLGCHHARLLAATPGARLVGVYDVRHERARQVATDLGTRAFPSLEGLLDAAAAVSVVVPALAHHDVGMAVLARGRHLLIEKPLAATVAEARALVSGAERAGVVLQPGHSERYNRAVRAAAPRIGAVRAIRGERTAPFQDRGTDVSVALDLMIHDLDLALAFVREPVVDVRALDGAGGGWDAATACITFATGAVAELHASRRSAATRRTMRIVQDDGVLALDLAAGRAEYRRGGHAAPAASGIEEAVSLDAPPAEPLALEVASFVGAARGGRGPAVTAADGLAAVELAVRVADALTSVPQEATA